MRSLIMAGGGIKVGFQAGVLQVMLDEAGMTFDHADGASGGCLNLAMYCQGMSGEQIADNWRNMNPLDLIAFNPDDLKHLADAPSIAMLDNLRHKVFPAWGLDFDKIRAGDRLGTFNCCNFTKKRLEVKTQDQMTEDLLVSSISLPMWFPPVPIDGDLYIDSVFLTDANVEEAIRRGADEIWAVWTVSTKPVWDGGFVAQYFQIIEVAADGRFFDIWRRLEQNNADIADGKPGEFGRPIELHLLQAEVPVHYLINFSKDRMDEVVNLGVETAREWLRTQNVATNSSLPVAPPSAEKISLYFTETMKGHVAEGATGFAEGEKAKNRTAISFTLTIGTNDLDSFLDLPEHEGTANGHLEIDALGGAMAVKDGIFNLLIDKGSETHSKTMNYRLFVEDAGGNPYTLVGAKNVNDDGGFFEVWKDTTTLYTHIYRGRVEQGQEAEASQWGMGIMHLGELALMKELTTFRVGAPGVKAKLEALNRFGEYFLGSLWDVYATRVLTYGPIG